MEILSAYGIPTKIVEAIHPLPFLFIVVLDYAIREATRDPDVGFMVEERQSSRKPTVYITDADFADDLALLSNYIEQAQLFLLFTFYFKVGSCRREYWIANKPHKNRIHAVQPGRS